jgi:hypothetical protein
MVIVMIGVHFNPCIPRNSAADYTDTVCSAVADINLMPYDDDDDDPSFIVLTETKLLTSTS